MPRKSQSPSFCVKQTDKKYTSPKRKSPPFKANLCCDEIMTGNDGNRWVSVANKKDICTWKPAKKCPKGKVRSPKGRCVNAKKQSPVKAKSAKKCPSGKKLSPTGKCIKDTRYGRPSPTESAKSFKEGHKKRGGDGQMYRIVVTKNDTKRWQKV